MMIQYVIMMYNWINEKFTKIGRGLKTHKNSTPPNAKSNTSVHNAPYGDISTLFP